VRGHIYAQKTHIFAQKDTKLKKIQEFKVEKKDNDLKARKGQHIYIFDKPADGYETITYTKKIGQKETDKFVKLFQNEMLSYAITLSPISLKVFVYFLSTLQYGNLIDIDQKTIIERCNISRSALAKSLKQLTDLKVIIINPSRNDSRANTYMMNHFAAYKGTATERQKAISNDKNRLFPKGYMQTQLLLK
jgi:hypothetical protein